MSSRCCYADAFFVNAGGGALLLRALMSFPALRSMLLYALEA